MKEVNSLSQSNVEYKKRKSAQFAINESASNSVSKSIGESYISLFALQLQASSFHIGLLSSLSGFSTPLAQLFGSKMMQNYPRKTIMLKFSLLQAMMWIPIALLAILYYKGIAQEYLIYFLIAFYVIFSWFTGIVYPSWFSWIGDLISNKHKGEYLSKLNIASGAVTIATLLIGAFIIDAFKTQGLAILGFSILFAIAFTFKLFSLRFIKKQYEPKFEAGEDYYFSFKSFLKRMDNYGRFSIFQGTLHFTLSFAGPFFIIYMSRILDFSVTTIMAITLSSTLFYLIFSPLIGKFSDKYGNKKLLIFSIIAFGINPILWIFIDKPILLIFIPQLIVGIGNAAFIIATSNFTYQSVSPKHRSICVSYTNVLSGIGMLFGALIGGLLLTILKNNQNPFVYLFAIAAILRLTFPLIMISRVKEIAKPFKVPLMYLYANHHIKNLHSELGFIYDLSKSRYAQGLKVWKYSKKHVLQKES
jgi:MFS family permease